jgi:3-deoxy-D-manno-octulosonic-acid transferase
MTLILLLYNLVMALLLPPALLYFLVRRLATGRAFAGVADRLALRLPPPPPAGGSAVWIHAVSVGEVLAVAPLVERFRREEPGTRVYLSTITPTGQATARKTLSGAVELFYCPYDLWWPVRRVLRRIRPRRLVIAETELWPTLLGAARRQGVPVSVVNGRISDRSLPQYRRMRFLLRPFLGVPEHFLMQTEEDTRRIRSLGAPSTRVRVAGNLKFDSLRLIQSDAPLSGAIGARWGRDRPLVLLCGSTMQGEEDLLADIGVRLRPDRPALRLLVAPRHPERFGRAAEAFRQRGLRVALRSRLDQEAPGGPVDVMILDTLGELAGLYPMADLVFIGGTLTPTGGHNVMEPAAAGRPILIGPSMENFREIAALFRQAGALEQAVDAVDFERRLIRLLDEPAEREALGRRALALVRTHQGATERCWAFIRRQEPAP